MKIAQVQAAAALALMAATLVGVAAWKPQIHLADQMPRIDLEAIFPDRFGSWAVDGTQAAQLVSPDTEAKLKKLYSQTLSRVYVEGERNERIMLSVAYGGDQSDATKAHRPEVCYPAQGFTILDERKTLISLGAKDLQVKQLLSRNGPRSEPITYWMTVGNRVAVSSSEQKLAQLSYSTRGLIPDGMIIRISSIDQDKEHAYRIHAKFIRSLASAVSESPQAQSLGLSQ